MEHVLLNSVTGEAAVAGQRADWVLGEPSSLTKDTEHVTLKFFFCYDFGPFFSFSFIPVSEVHVVAYLSLSRVFLCHPGVISLLLVKPHGDFFPAGNS